MSDPDVDTCPICAEPLLPADLCATDIEMGICHAACLEGSPTVDMETGEEVDGPMDTYRYGDTAPGSERHCASSPLPEVRKLSWAHHDGNYPTWRASNYAISFEAVIDRGAARMYGGFPLRINGRYSEVKHDTLEAAKAAAQCSFEKRVRDFLRSALVDVPAVEPEPMAWEVAFTAHRSPSKGLFYDLDSARSYTERHDSSIITALYAHPPRSALVDNSHASEAVVELSEVLAKIKDYGEDAQPGSEYRLACDDLIELFSSLRPAGVGSATKSSGTGGGE